MKIISISNQKGGCGKTTTTINLAGALAYLGKKTLVIDLDPQSHATFGLGLTTQAIDASIYNVLTDNPEKRRTINDCITNISQNLDLIPSNILLSTLEQELKDKEDAVSRLHQILSSSTLNYDYTLIDCPPNLGFLTFNSLRAAELIIVPIDMSAFSLMGVGKLLGMLELIKLKIGHAPNVKALATIFDRRTKYSQTMLDEITKFFKEQMLETVIRISVALKKAAFAGMPAIQADETSNGAKDHLTLAKEILKFDGDLEFEKAIAEATQVVNNRIKNDATQEETALVENIVNTAAPVNRLNSITSKEPELITSNSNITQKTDSLQDDILKIDTANSRPSRTELVFALDTPNAKEVYIVGDFNHWKINEESRLSQLNYGKWEKRIALPPGKYRYKFVVDGEWTVDSQNSQKEPNPFGTYDSIVKL